MDQPITERVQRTERRFTEHSGTFAELAVRSQIKRIWLDNGQQKQVARNIHLITNPITAEPLVCFMVRGAEDKQLQYECAADATVLWYEEVS